MTLDYPPDEDVNPPQLLDDYLAVARACPQGALHATALRTGSLTARHLLAHAATGGTVPLASLLAAVRSRRRPTLQARRLHPGGLADLARLIGLQELHPTDEPDALALYELVRELAGPAALSPEHQAMHAQLAFRVGERALATTLLDSYQQIPNRTAQDLRIDLANPFAAGRSRGNEREWLKAFRRSLPKPYPDLAPAQGTSPFDRLVTTARYRRIEGGDRISVIVTAYRPGAELLAAVRSLVAQSWTNLEILVVDDCSPPEHDVVLRQCLELDPRVRLIRLDTNRGTYVARNAGIDAAAGPYVTFHDSDDWAHPRRLEEQVRTLLDDRSVCTTLTDGLRVTDRLVLTRPGRQRAFLYPSSVMFHRDTVVGRVGYFDQIRKGADGEYLARIEAAFGPEAVRHERGALYTVRRLSKGSLSEAEFRAEWMHPARAAYKSAYHLWHHQIREGSAAPYLPIDPPRRQFAAPTHLRRSRDQPAPRQRYDVVVAGDWRPVGRMQDCMVEQVRALVGRGLRVAVAHLESFRAMTKQHQHLRRPIQELVNRGVVTQALLTDAAETALLLIHHPPVLQFPPSRSTGLRAQQTVIFADVAPSAPDRSEHRYSARSCAQAARAMFGAEPVWCPQGHAVRGRLAADLPPASLTPVDLPGVVDVDKWWTDRRRFRLDRPVIGRHLPDVAATWPEEPDALLAAYPADAGIDVRMLGGAEAAKAVLDTSALPTNWVVYSPDEVGVRSFLNQLDFYVYFPRSSTVELPGRALGEALAAGCVTILPHRFSSNLGDAAVYCEPSEVADVVRALRADQTAYSVQSQRARDRARASYSHVVYTDLMSAFIAGSGTAWVQPVNH